MLDFGDTTAVGRIILTEKFGQVDVEILSVAGKMKCAYIPCDKVSDIGECFVVSVVDDEGNEHVFEEMDRRYDSLVEDCARNQIQYNQRHPDAQIPTTVVLLDGFDRIINSGDHNSELLHYVRLLTMKSRAAGIKFIALINKMPENAEYTLEYFGTPVNVFREGFNTRDVTNTILKSFYNLGYEPCIRK